MNPDQIATVTAIAAILSKVGTWPIGSILFTVFFGPYIIGFFAWRAIENRHKAAISMYENNVKMVERYEKMAQEHVDTIRLTTAAITELIVYLRNRTPCFERIQERKSR